MGFTSKTGYAIHALVEPVGLRGQVGTPFLSEAYCFLKGQPSRTGGTRGALGVLLAAWFGCVVSFYVVM